MVTPIDALLLPLACLPFVNYLDALDACFPATLAMSAKHLSLAMNAEPLSLGVHTIVLQRNTIRLRTGGRRKVQPTELWQSG